MLSILSPKIAASIKLSSMFGPIVAKCYVSGSANNWRKFYASGLDTLIFPFGFCKFFFPDHDLGRHCLFFSVSFSTFSFFLSKNGDLGSLYTILSAQFYFSLAQRTNKNGGVKNKHKKAQFKIFNILCCEPLRYLDMRRIKQYEF